MALGTGHYTSGVGGDLEVDVPEIWGQRINDYFRYSLKLANFFIDRSDELAGGGATIYTPNLSALSTNAKSTGSQVTLSSPTYTTQTLLVSTWREASFVIEDREIAQVKQSYYIQEKIALGGAYEVAQDLDDAIAALFTGFTTNVVGLGTANMADSSLLAAMAILETAGVPMTPDQVSWIFHPNTFYRQIGSVDKLTLWTNTNSESPRTKMPTPILYGFPVIITAAVPVGAGAAGDNGARLNVFAHKDAIHWAKLGLPGKAAKSYVGSEGVRVQQSYVHEYLGDLVTMDLCYGVVENRDDAAVKMRSHSIAVGL